MSTKRNRGLVFRALKYLSEIAYPFRRNEPSEHHQLHRHLDIERRGRKASSRGVRIKARLLLAVVTLHVSRCKSSAFSVDDLSKRQLGRIPNTATKYLVSIGMYQNGDNMSENPDNQEENDDNKHEGGDVSNHPDGDFKKLEKDYIKRITRLEDIVSRQEVELYRLRNTCNELSKVTKVFEELLQLLRDAGLDADNFVTDNNASGGKKEASVGAESSTGDKTETSLTGKVVESYDDDMIFGTAPSSVIEAADGAGAAILAAMLGGKQRILVDVRDAELSSDPETLVHFIELAILPIAAGLEGLKSTRNRVKIVFPKVSQLLEYRRTMALAAPEVIALSTLAFDPVERRDKLVVIVAPEPDDEEGIQAIRDLLTPSEEDGVPPIQQPVVILNYHMLPFSGTNVDFVTAYHLRLLTVQYMADVNPEEFAEEPKDAENFAENLTESDLEIEVDTEVQSSDDFELVKDDNIEEIETDDEALESAMKHAHEVGVNEGVTRAMVIRAYPKPWHVFVDLSPNTDADYEVAATFDKEPTMEEVNLAIVECLEGSEREDEIVAQQMQQALEDGQLNQDSLKKYLEDDEDDFPFEDDEDDDFDMFEEDSV